MEKRFGDFEIEEEIGKGGMGQVYKARQISLDRYVAIKVLPADMGDVEEFRERFDIEAKAVASLMHENILQVYSKGVTDGGAHYFAMEYVDGEDLADKIKRGVTFTEAEAIDIAVQICRGLEAAWKNNIIHRDIKPSNIMVARGGTVKIADFGLAKSLNATKKLTQTNMYMGTVAYTSPEQGEGKPLDHRTDIYSLGIVFYQLLTGSVPFSAETPSSIIFKHVYETPPSPRSMNPRISAQAEAVVLKAIAKRPEDRFQNAVEFRNALESVKRGQPEAKSEAQTQAAVFAAEAKSRSNSLVLIVAIALILLVGGPALYAAKYGYKALLSKVLPSAQEETKVEQALPQAGDVATPPAQEAVVSNPEPHEVASAVPQEMANMQPPVPGGKGGGAARGGSGRTTAPAETTAVPAAQPRAPKRSALPAVLLVTSGEANISDIVESVIGRKLQQRSFPLSTADEIGALTGQYGRHDIPLNALEQRQLKADILVYVSVSTMDAGPLEFYGQSMEQYASTISVRVIDTATQRTIVSNRTKTVNYTTLTMQDNIEEAAGELVSDLPGRLIAFWKG